MLRLALIGALVICTPAWAESSVATGAGKLSASAAINIKVVIPSVLGLNDKAQVTSNGGPREIVVQTRAYEGYVQLASTDWGFLPVAGWRTSAEPFLPVIPVTVLTVSKP